MKLSNSSRRILIAICVFVILLVVITIFILYRSRSKYRWPEAASVSASISGYSTYQTNLTACQNQYAIDSINPATAAAASSNRTTCINTATRTYLNSRCPAVTDTAAPSAGVSYYSNYTALQTTIQNIRTRFLNVMTNPTAVFNGQTALSSTTVTIDPADSVAGGIWSPANSGSPTVAEYATYLVRKARDAAIAGATRKYIALSCTDYFMSGDGLTNLGPAYAAWDYAAYSPNSGGNYITNADVLAWVKRAGFVNAAGTETPYYKYASGNTNTVYNAANTAYDVTTVAGTPTSNKKPYEVARYNGPGSAATTGNTAAGYTGAAASV